ncbi:LifA/Efa1-related large cytotoxin [Chlamydia sp. 12-01]|uniref:LifA/Efa1-related large cytotoxin n=1 Tax=Chlamydia sp. 12-01 TaxID=3002742 RepID=UPI0035D4E1F7
MTLPEKTTPATSTPTSQSNYTVPSTSNSSYSNQSTIASSSLDERLNLYDEAVNQNNSTESVVELGKKLQQEFFNLTNETSIRSTVSPSNHSGNWKTSFLYNLAQLVAHVVPTKILPAKITKPTVLPPPTNHTETSSTHVSRRTNSSISENSTSLTQPSIGGGGGSPRKKRILAKLVKASASSRSRKPTKTPTRYSPTHIPNSTSFLQESSTSLEQSIGETSSALIKKETTTPVQKVEKDLHSLSRRKRGLEDGAEISATQKYDLTPENIVDRLQLTPDQIKTCQTPINNLKKAVGRYNALENQNSRKGQDLLVKQSTFLETIYKRAKISKTSPAQQVMSTIKTEFLSHKVKVDKHLHGIWIAGSPPDETDAYIKVFLQTYTDFDFLFWVDETAYGAAKFSSTLKKIAFDSSLNDLRKETGEDVKKFVQYFDELKAKYDSTENLEERQQYYDDLLQMYNDYERVDEHVKNHFNAIFLRNIIVSQDGFFNFCMLKGVDAITDDIRIEYLEKTIKLPKEEIEQYKKTIETNKKKIQDIVSKVNSELGSTRVIIKDVKELTRMKDRTHLYNYETEMLLRWNYAAASDQIRMFMLEEHGGIYTDLDIMPTYSQEVTDIIYKKGGNRFFESLQVRRALSDAALKIANGETAVTLDQIAKEIETSELTDDDRDKITQLISEFEKIHKGEGGGQGKTKKSLFQTMAPEIVRDTMPILRRYHKWSTGWHIRGLNGLMMSHKDSALVDAVIRGQWQAYAELRALRENILSGEFFNTLEDLKHLDRDQTVGGHFVKDYLGKSLFYDFRQDSVIPGAVSTLGITGPGLIRNEMIKYFKGLGPMGKAFLSKDGSKLGDDAYLGSYKQIKTPEGEITYDWTHPLSIGSNDVTPGDESTWCNIKRPGASELLFSDSSKLRVETPKGVERTKIDQAEFIKLWSDESKKNLPGGLLTRFNHLITDRNIDIVRMSELDHEIYSFKMQIKDDVIAQASMFSLQLQIAQLIRDVKLPVSNHVNYFPNPHQHIEDDLEKAIRLYLNSNSQTGITVWYSSSSDLSMFLKDMLSVAERQLAIGNLIDSINTSPISITDIEILTKYSEFSSKDSMDCLTTEETDKFLEITSKIAENRELQAKVNQIEEQVSSGQLFKELQDLVDHWLTLSDEDRKKAILDKMKEMARGSGIDGQEQKNIEKWYEKLYDDILQKRVTDPKKKLEDIVKKFESSERVTLQNLDHFLSDESLFSRMHRDGYSFNDLNDLYRFIVANTGVSGIFASDSVFPSPSNHLVDMMKATLDADYENMHDHLDQVYNYLALDPGTPEAKAALEEIPEALRKELEKSHTPDLLTPPVDAYVSALGMQYGVDNGMESNRIMTSAIPGIFNPTSHTMANYFDGLYELHRHIHDSSLTKDSAKKLLEDRGIHCFAYDDRLEELVKLAGDKQYLSLTQIHQILSKTENFAQASGHLLSSILPGASDIFQREATFGRPSATAMQNPTAINPYDYRGVGASKDLFSTPSDVPTIQNAVERAKYSLFSWPDFSREHIPQWSDLAKAFGSDIAHIHPQTFLYDLEGRCMGLSMLYMSANDAIEYTLITRNLMTTSSLFQTRERDHLQLTESDNTFLEKSRSYIDWLQYQGNKDLKTKGILTERRWDIGSLSRMFGYQKEMKSFLVTTPSHSIVVQAIDKAYRVTDPNFGHCDFPTLSHALLFLESSVQLTDEVRDRYGISSATSIQEQLKVYTVDSTKAANTWFPSTNLGFSYDQYMTTLYKMTLRGDVRLGRRRISWADLYRIGGTIDHRRIDEKTREGDLDKLKLDGDILSDYLSKHVLDADLAATILYILDTYGTEVGTKEVSRKLIVETPRDLTSLISGIKSKAQQMSSMLRNVMEEIGKAIKGTSAVDKDKISVTNVDVNGDEISFELKEGESTKKVKIPSHGLVKVFKELGSMLNDLAGTGVMDIELGMSALSIIQYARLVEAGKGDDAQAIFDLFLDGKEMAEMTLGTIVQGVGKKFITEQGIDGFRLESVLAKKLMKTSTKVGGTLGKALFRVGQMLELPILEAVAGVWGLYTSIEDLQHASSHSDKMGARVQVAFDVITLTLTLSAVVAPAAMLAAGPIAAIGMGASSIARNIALTEERHEAWNQYKRFLEEGSEHIVDAFPDRGLLDFSNNHVLGNIVLDLRQNPPILKGDRSYNANRWIGHKPGWSDSQVREKLSYAFSITPYSALAKGHANSYWPPEVPKIPAGTYNTVILGYGITYQGTTEVVYLSNQIVWREAVLDPTSRYYVPPLTAKNHKSKVITGNTQATIIPVRLLDKDSQERIDYASQYKDYEITVEGGKGGITVQIGGAGFYNITGASGVENVISFRAIPPPLGVKFNLAQLVQEVPLTRPNGTSIDILKIRQKGISTVIGSSGGQDNLAGNRDTKFYPSPGGGIIYSGAGKNWYYIPKLDNNLTIVLTPNSTDHDLTLGMSSFELHSGGDNLNLLGLNGDNSTGIYIENANKSSSYEHWVGHFKVKFSDGITVEAIEKPVSGNSTNTTTLGFTKCDQSTWALKHPEESGFVDNIVRWMKKYFWWFAPEVSIVQQHSHVSYYDENKLFVYKPDKHTELDIRAQNEFEAVVEGSVGSSYLLSSPPNIKTKSTKIALAEDGDSPQLIDLGLLVPSLIKGKMTSKTAIELEVSSPRYTVPVVLSWDPGDPPWKTVIEVNSYVRATLGEWHRKIQQHPEQTHVLYHNSVLVPERLEGILSLNNTVTLMLSESNKTKEHILGVENKGGIDLKIWGTLHAGHIEGAMMHQIWTRFRNSASLKVFDITVPAYSIKYLDFEGSDRSGGNILFNSILESKYLKADIKPKTKFSHNTWRWHDEIQIFSTSLELEDFYRYRIDSETQILSRYLMYSQKLVSIQNRDFILKFFFVREGKGVGAIRFVFKNFFHRNLDGISEKTLEKEAKPLMASNPHQFIDPSYRDHLELTLGKETFNLATMVREYCSYSYILPLGEDEQHRLTIPREYWSSSLSVLTYTIDSNKIKNGPENTLLFFSNTMKEYRLPLTTILKSSYYLDPVSGDLYITRLITALTSWKNEAFVLTLKEFKQNWETFKDIFILAPHTELTTSTATALTFVGPELRHFEINFPMMIADKRIPERLVSRAGSIFPTNDQVINYDPRADKQFYTLPDYMLWNLRDRTKGSSKRAKAYDSYLLGSAMHLSSKEPKWKIPDSMLQYAIGYYRVQVPQWVRSHMRTRTLVKMPKGSIKISLITTQNDIFDRKPGGGYNIYFALLGLDKHVKAQSEKPGDMLLDLNQDVILKVQKIDESEYSRKRIYVVAEIATEAERRLEPDSQVIVLPGGERFRYKRNVKDNEEGDEEKDDQEEEEDDNDEENEDQDNDSN